jgi:hypothetical protein
MTLWNAHFYSVTLLQDARKYNRGFESRPFRQLCGVDCLQEVQVA